jgi:hypothetical protein
MSQLYRIYSNIYFATKKTLHTQGMGHIDLSKYRLKHTAKDKRVLQNMETLSRILKHPEFAHLSKK